MGVAVETIELGLRASKIGNSSVHYEPVVFRQGGPNPRCFEFIDGY